MTKPNTLAEAARNFADTIDWHSCNGVSLRPMQERIFLAGAAWQRAQILELLRSKKANDEGVVLHPSQWADWLEKRLQDGDK